MIHRTIFLAATAILLLVSVSVFVTTAQADGSIPDVDTAERDDVVPEDEGDEDASGQGGTPLPGVDTAERDDVVPEDEGEGRAARSAATAPAPTGLKATASTDTSVSLSWTAVTDAGAYKVEYRKSGSTTWRHAGYVYSGASDKVDGLDCNTTYHFQVRARGDGSPYSYRYSDPSTSVSKKTRSCSPVSLPSPPAPSGLKATASTQSSVSLNWSSVTNAYRYKLERRTGTTGS